MGAAEKIPWTELAFSADECAGLFGLSKDRFLRTIACTTGFPERVNLKPAAWKVGEVIDWRDANRFRNRKKRA